MATPKKLHILGICGTFMGSLAQIAKQLGYEVSGSDAGMYPPMSDQLLHAGIAVSEGFRVEDIPTDVEWVIIGNALSRGNSAVEYVLEQGLPYISGPQWLGQEVLRHRHVLAVAGTHGKTTTASMLAWILDDAGLNPSYLIGGVPENFGTSARLTDSPYFVIEADEYDTAFFDKRSKFVHYYPRTFVLNNLEFDHADIFPDLAAIERQFHHAIRTVPASGKVLVPTQEPALERVVAQGMWSELVQVAQASEKAAAGWQWQLIQEDASSFEVIAEQQRVVVTWQLGGLHNVKNAVMAMAAAAQVGVSLEQSAAALGQFASVKRRLEKIGESHGVVIYDDFAHHPTEIATTLEGVRRQYPQARILAVLEPRSNTMKLGVHKDHLAAAVDAADLSVWLQPEHVQWSVTEVAEQCRVAGLVFKSVEAMIEALVAQVQSGDVIVVMSNGSFANMPRRFWAALSSKANL